tara:strand:+ start:212 stop:589 length:378 start_codon:yes stop_codon:yes gene_type:complete
MAKMGRPRKELDWGEFIKLCQMHCTLVEIAGWFDCSEDTIELRCKEEYGVTFTEVHKKYEGQGKASLRRLQWAGANKGNTTMLIWLGKQYLGQRDKNEQRNDNTLVIKHEYVDAPAEKDDENGND